MKLSLATKHFVVIVFICNTIPTSLAQSQEELDAINLLEDLNQQFIEEKLKLGILQWNYASNTRNDTAMAKAEGEKIFAAFREAKAEELLKFDFSSFENETLKRQIDKMTFLEDAWLNDESFKAIKNAITKMQDIYAVTWIPMYQNETEMVALEPDIIDTFRYSRDPEELKYYWTQWHDKVGTPNKDSFFEYAKLRNEAAKLNGYETGAEMWLSVYDDPTFVQQIDQILEDLMPTYKLVHGYVRYKLNQVHGDDIVNITQPIPIHLLGNMWGQQWNDVADLVIPYPNKPTLDVTDEMHRQNYTPLKMFQMGDEFFTSMNMTKLPEQFWENSILEKPTDGRELICHASAWDLMEFNNVRIKQCTRVNMDDFVTVHHELGHVQYYLQYQNQSVAFRDGANPGFHEAIGDVLALSVGTAKHLEKVGLLTNYTYDNEAEINQFVRQAMAKFAFLPFAYTMDKFRWGVFHEEITPENGNCEFWKMRVKYGGVEPPVVRSNDDFDITAKYHAAADVEYLRYFVSFITQFQFHKAACTLAGEYEEGNPDKAIHNCDIFESAEAGNAMKTMLEMGSSKPWPDVMEVMTGQRKMDAGPILEYFQPLKDFLTAEVEKLGINVGWELTDKLKCDNAMMRSEPIPAFPEFPAFPAFPSNN